MRVLGYPGSMPLSRLFKDRSVLRVRPVEHHGTYEIGTRSFDLLNREEVVRLTPHARLLIFISLFYHGCHDSSQHL